MIIIKIKSTYSALSSSSALYKLARFASLATLMSFSQNLLKSGVEVYGAATSFIFKNIIAVMNIHITFTIVKQQLTMPVHKVKKIVVFSKENYSFSASRCIPHTAG